jgi:hypothetical protein
VMVGGSNGEGIGDGFQIRLLGFMGMFRHYILFCVFQTCCEKLSSRIVFE